MARQVCEPRKLAYICKFAGECYCEHYSDCYRFYMPPAIGIASTTDTPAIEIASIMLGQVLQQRLLSLLHAPGDRHRHNYI